MFNWIIGNYALGLIVGLVFLLTDKSFRVKKTKREIYYWFAYPLWGGFSSIWFTLSLIWLVSVYLKEQLQLLKKD